MNFIFLQYCDIIYSMSTVDTSYLEWVRFFTKTLPDKYSVDQTPIVTNGKHQQLPKANNKKKNQAKV